MHAWRRIGTNTMRKQLVSFLNQLNQQFYAQVSDSFSKTRSTAWQGWNQLLPFLKKKPTDSALHILDLGCGNGRFVEFLSVHLKDAFAYMGMDSSAALLDIARMNHLSHKFVQFDVVQKYLETGKIILPTTKKFDLIVLFGLSHHLPSLELRRQLLLDLQNYLNPDGHIVVSNWQFANELKRFEGHILSLKTLWHKEGIYLWRKIQLAGALLCLEKDDFILDWRAGQQADGALRYCHYIDEAEMKKLVDEVGLEIVHSFFADGKSRQLNQYFVLQSKNR